MQEVTYQVKCGGLSAEAATKEAAREIAGRFERISKCTAKITLVRK